MKKILIISLLGVFTLGCKTQQATVSESDTITMKIVQINDVYEIDAINAGKNGGLARVAYIRDSIKNDYPNTYYFLAGDFLNPSLLGTIKVDGERLEGKQMVEVLNASDLDLVTFGNHEFDLKEKDLLKRLNESNFKWTTANALHVTESGKHPFRMENENRSDSASDYEIYTATNSSGNSIKFGVFSVVLPSNPKDYVFYGDIYDEAERAYYDASKVSDFVIGLTHVAIEEDKEIAKRIPNLPLIMGGHEHNNMLHKVGKTVIAKADANAVSLYVHTLKYNTKTKNLNVDSELVMVTDKQKSSPKVQKVVDKWNKVLDDNLSTLVQNPNEVIYNAVVPLDGTDTASRSEQTNLGVMIAQSMVYVYDDKPQAAILNGGGIRIDDHLEGDVTSKDIFRVLPFGGSVFKVDMTGELLEKVLDYGENAVGTGAYLQRYNLVKNANGKWLIGNQPIDKNKVYNIAMNDFLMMGLDVPFLNADNPGVKKIEKPNEGEIAHDIRSTIINYIKNGL